MSCHVIPGARQVRFRPCLRSLWDGKADEVPLEVNTPWRWRPNTPEYMVEQVLNQTDLAKCEAAQYLPVADWMESGISVIWGLGIISLWKIKVRYHSFFPCLRTHQIRLLKGKALD